MKILKKITKQYKKTSWGQDGTQDRQEKTQEAQIRSI